MAYANTNRAGSDRSGIPEVLKEFMLVQCNEQELLKTLTYV